LQLVGYLFIVGYNAFITTFLMLVIKYVLRVPLRMSDEMLLIGDDAAHGEEAYCFYDDHEQAGVVTPGQVQPDRLDLEIGVPPTKDDPTNGGGKLD
jgi:ammonium transporter, Amt family